MVRTVAKISNSGGIGWSTLKRDGSYHVGKILMLFNKKGEEAMAKDPVCNMSVDEKKAAAISVYKGETYYFCAKICKEKFDKEPEKFIGKEKE